MITRKQVEGGKQATVTPTSIPPATKKRKFADSNPSSGSPCQSKPQQVLILKRVDNSVNAQTPLSPIPAPAASSIGSESSVIDSSTDDSSVILVQSTATVETISTVGSTNTETSAINQVCAEEQEQVALNHQAQIDVRDDEIPVPWFACKECRKYFVTLDGYKNHFADEIDTILCVFCKQSFTGIGNFYNLHQHVKVTHEQYGSCSYCKQIFPGLIEAEIHQNKCVKCRRLVEANNHENGNSNIKLLVINDESDLDSLLNNDNVEDIIEPLIKCRICQKNFKDIGAYNLHIDGTGEILRCIKCEATFMGEGKYLHLHEHVRSCHGKLPFCTNCKDIFERQIGLVQHWRNGCNKCRAYKNDSNIFPTIYTVPAAESEPKFFKKTLNVNTSYSKVLYARLLEKHGLDPSTLPPPAVKSKSTKYRNLVLSCDPLSAPVSVSNSSANNSNKLSGVVAGKVQNCESEKRSVSRIQLGSGPLSVPDSVPNLGVSNSNKLSGVVAGKVQNRKSENQSVSRIQLGSAPLSLPVPVPSVIVKNTNKLSEVVAGTVQSCESENQSVSRIQLGSAAISLPVPVSNSNVNNNTNKLSGTLVGIVLNRESIFKMEMQSDPVSEPNLSDNNTVNLSRVEAGTSNQHASGSMVKSQFFYAYSCSECLLDFTSKNEVELHAKNCTHIIDPEKAVQNYLAYKKLGYKVIKHRNLKFIVACPTCQTDVLVFNFISKDLHPCLKKNTFICPFCNKKKSEILKTSTLATHLDEHCDVLVPHETCNKCGKTVFNKYNMSIHNHLSHRVITEEEKLEKKTKVRSTVVQGSLEHLIPKDSKKPISKRVVVNKYIPTLNLEIPCVRCTATSCYKFIPINLYDEHRSRHIYICIFCKQLFPIERFLKYHLGWCLISRVIVYEYYIEDDALFNKIKSDPITLLTKETIYSEPPPTTYKPNPENQCPVCYEQFQFHCQLSKHQLDKKHDWNVYQCSDCRVQFGTLIAMGTHSKKHKDYFCSHCSEIFMTVPEYLKHIDDVHEIRNDDNNINMECQFCLKIKTDPFKIQKHFEKHHLDKKFSCKACRIKVWTKEDLVKHLVTSHNIKPYECTSCKFQFSKKQFLAYHLPLCDDIKKKLSL